MNGWSGFDICRADCGARIKFSDCRAIAEQGRAAIVLECCFALQEAIVAVKAAWFDDLAGVLAQEGDDRDGAQLLRGAG